MAQKDFAKYDHDILHNTDIEREFQLLGGRTASTTPNDKGWLSCYAFDRDEANASAAINVACTNGHRGQYTDLAGGKQSKAIRFFELAARMQPSRFPTWRDARNFYAEQAGVKLNDGGKPKSGKRSLDGQIQFYAASSTHDPVTFRGTQWLSHKAGIDLASIKKAGARAGTWNDYCVLVFAGIRPPDTKPCSLLMYRSNGRDFPAVEGKLPARKTHLVGGSVDGLVIIGTLDEFNAARVVVKCEGTTDALAVASHLPTGFIAVTNSHGARSFPAELAKCLRGKIVWLIHDADEAGESGAISAAATIANYAAETYHVRLPYGVAASHGKDLRDWLNEGGSFAELTTYADLTAPTQATAPAAVADDEEASGGESDDQLTNATTEKVDDETITTPHSMAEIKADIVRLADNWPRRVGKALFVHDHHGVSWLENSSALFGFLADLTGPVHWKRQSGCATKDEVFCELERTAMPYRNVEAFPHEPLVTDHYYSCSIPEPGDGSTLARFVGFFNPETEIDRDLIKALLLTLCWGGPGGTRPAFVITSTAGRGAGKSKSAEMFAYVFGGTLSFSNNDDINAIKTRLLSPDALSKRAAMLDNVKTLRFSWGELEGLITTPAISGKRMYVGEGGRPNLLTWLITLNGASLSTDLAQRCVIIRINRPNYSGDWEEDVARFVDENRQAIIADLIAILRAPADRLRKHSRWGAWEKSILARLPEPADAQAVILERQAVADVESEEATMLEDSFADQLAKFGYSPARELVHIPSEVAARWYGFALGVTGERTASVSRTLKQMCDEGRLPHIKPNPSRTNGRGFVWSGDEAKANQTIGVAYDLKDRIAKFMAEKNER